MDFPITITIEQTVDGRLRAELPGASAEADSLAALLDELSLNASST